MEQQTYKPFPQPTTAECVYCLNRQNLRETAHGDLICVDQESCRIRRPAGEAN